MRVFGALCGDEPLPLYICSGAFTADQYRDVLSELYLESANWQRLLVFPPL